MATSLRLVGVSKRFREGPRNRYVQAVDDVTLTIESGETVALVGESGSGKSTLGRIALRLTDADDGEVYWGGLQVSRMNPRQLRRHRHLVQPIFQDPVSAFNPRHSVAEALGQAVRRAPDRPRRRAVVDEMVRLLELVRLTPALSYLNRYPHQLSGGQRQRVAVARAIAIRPAIIVADEPLSGADVSVRGQLLNLLREVQLQTGVGYLMITHDISLAREFADRVAVLEGGAIVEEGNARSVLRDPVHPYTRRLVASVPQLVTQ